MSWWEWALFGLALLALEVLTPGGFFVIFFGAAGLLVGLLVAVGAGGPLWLQVLLFSSMAIISLVLFRGPLLRAMKTEERPAVDTFEGGAAVMLEDVAPGATGKAELRGTTWTALNAGGNHVTRGQRVRVERVEGLTLRIHAE